MITNNKVEKYLVISAIAFITYLLLGSFVVSRNYFELLYLIVLYMFVFIKIIFYK